jgi:hypothetical protein
MIVTSPVEWTPLIELLAVIVVALGGVIFTVWTVACGAKRCASKAIEEVARADEQSQNMKETIDGFRIDMRDGFDRVHERLDKFIGGE